MVGVLQQPGCPDVSKRLRTRLTATETQIINGYEALARGNQNPLYAWQAAYYCMARKIKRPDWIEDYFASVIINLAHLQQRAGGLDGLMSIPTAGGEPYRDSGALTPGDALADVAWALSLSRSKGASAFSRLASDAKHEADATLDEAYRLFPRSGGKVKARTVIAARRVIKSDSADDAARQISRRVARGRTLKNLRRADDS